MRLNDACKLIVAKLKIRKLRTAITIATTSVLFGVITCVLISASGITNNLMKASGSFFDGSTIFAVDYYHDGDSQAIVQEEALKLYSASSNPDKLYPVITPMETGEVQLPPYLDNTNPFAISAAEKYINEQNSKSVNAVMEMATLYDGQADTVMNYYEVRQGTLTIDGITKESSWPGMRVAAVSGDALSALIKSHKKSDDAIQILMSVDEAAKVLNISKPTGRDSDRDKKIIDYIDEVNKKAIGFTFSGVISSDIEDTEDIRVAYEVVGLLPYYDPPQAMSFSVDPVDMLINSLIVNNYPLDSFIVVNQDSEVFTSIYTLDISNSLYSTRVLVGFPDINKANAFAEEHSCGNASCSPAVWIGEFMNNQQSLQIVLENVDRLLVAFIVVFSIIAGIIMAGTLYRIISDDYKTIALYRAVGASTKDVLQIFIGYTLVLCLLIIACSAIIGTTLSIIVSMTHSLHLTAVVSEMYSIPDLSALLLIGLDHRILFLSLAIIMVGILCFPVVIGKLLSNNIIKTLRQ